MTASCTTRRIDGGSGSDTLRVSAGGADLRGGMHQVRNIEVLDLRGGVGSAVSLDSSGLITLSGAPHYLLVHGDSDDLLNLTGAWQTADGASDGFLRFESGALQVDVATRMQVFSAGVLALNGVNGFRLDGESGNDRAGASVSGGDDLNGDGYADIVIGAPKANASVTDSGAAYVVYGGTGSGATTRALGPATSGTAGLDGQNGYRIDGILINDRAGKSVALLGDVDGDGFYDLLIGAPFNDSAANDAGAAYLVFGAATVPNTLPNLALNNLDGNNGLRLSGHASSDYSGYAVSSAGDFNGDGFADFVIGAEFADPHGTNSGSTYLIYSAENFSASIDLTMLNGDSGLRIDGTTPNDNSGKSVAAAGDVNGDGYGDLLIGAPGSDTSGDNAGSTYLLFGTTSGFAATLDLSSLDGSRGLRFDGRILNTGSDVSGADVSSASDLNGDGYDDIVIGAEGTGGPSGSAYVIFGRDFSGAVTQQGGAAHDTLRGSSAAEILIGGRGDDVLDGVSGADVLRGGAGDDVLVWFDGLRHVDGGSGVDTLRIDGASVNLDFTPLANHTVSGIENIDLSGSGNNALTVSFRDVLTLGEHSTLRIDGNAGDSVTSAAQGWSVDPAGAINIGGQQYASFTHLGATLLVDSDITTNIS